MINWYKFKYSYLNNFINSNTLNELDNLSILPRLVALTLLGWDVGSAGEAGVVGAGVVGAGVVGAGAVRA